MQISYNSAAQLMLLTPPVVGNAPSLVSFVFSDSESSAANPALSITYQFINRKGWSLVAKWGNWE